MKIKTTNILYFVLVAIIFFSCKKDDKSPIPIATNSDKADIKVIYTSAYTIRDSVQIKVNDERVSNTFISSAATTFVPTPFPGGGLNTGGSGLPTYLEVDPGAITVSVSVPKLFSSSDSIVKYSGTTSVEANKKYSIYITDTAANTKSVTVLENTAPVDNGFSRYKFVNLIPNLPAVDLYFGTTLVSAAVPYGTVGTEFQLPFNSSAKWFIRPAGALPASTSIATYPGTTLTNLVLNQRILTVFCKGYSGGTAAKTPVISLLYN